MSQIRRARLRASQGVRLTKDQMMALLARMGCRVSQGGTVKNVYGASAQADLVIESWQGRRVRSSKLGLKQNADGSWTFLDGLSGLTALGTRTIQRGISGAIAGMETASKQAAKPKLQLRQVGEQQIASLQLGQVSPEHAVGLTGLKMLKLDSGQITLQLPSGQFAELRETEGQLEMVAPAEAHEELRQVAGRIQEEEMFALALGGLRSQVEDIVELKALPLVRGLDTRVVIQTLAGAGAEEAIGLKAIALSNPQDTILPGALPGIAFETQSGNLVGLRQTPEGRLEFIAPASAEPELAMAQAALDTKGAMLAAAQDPRMRGLKLDWGSLSVEETEEEGPVIDFHYTDEKTGPVRPKLAALKQVLVGGIR